MRFASGVVTAGLIGRRCIFMKYCPTCRLEFPDGKFCAECGGTLGEKPSPERRSHSGGVSVGSRNIVAGDIIGHREEISVGGNATIIRNSDESKQVRHCAVCGKASIVVDGHACRSCGEWVCSKHMVFDDFRCVKCRDASLVEAKQAYLQKFQSAFSDNKVSVEERLELEALARRLGLTAEHVRQIEQGFKAEVIGRSLSKMDRRDVRRLETARDFLFRDGEAGEALSLLESLYRDFESDENVRDLYLLALAEIDQGRARVLLPKIPYDDLAKHHMQIHLLALAGDIDGAYRALKLAKISFGDDHPQLLAREAELSLDEFRATENRRCLDDARGLLSKLPDDGDDMYLQSVLSYLRYCDGDRNALAHHARECKSRGASSFYHDRKIRQLKATIRCACGAKLDVERFCGQCGRDNPRLAKPAAGPAGSPMSDAAGSSYKAVHHCGRCGAETASTGFCGQCGASVSFKRADIDSGRRSFAGLFAGNIAAYFAAEEADLRQLFAYVRHSPHVTGNTQYEATAKTTDLIVNACDHTINAYAIDQSGNPQVHILGGAVAFARLCGALRETVGRNGLQEFGRIWALVGKTIRDLRGALPPEHALRILQDAGGGAFWKDEALIRAGLEHAAGMLTVIMAHELGHLALGHTLGPAANLEVSRNMEREADSFASSIISSSQMSIKPIEGMILWEVAWAWADNTTGNSHPTTHPLWRERIQDFVRANETIAGKLGITLSSLNDILPPAG